MTIAGIELRSIDNAGVKEGEILVYDVIGGGFLADGITAKDFDAALKALGNVKTLRVRVNSPGGSVTQGAAIHTMLKNHPAKKIGSVEGLAASIATHVLMACDEIDMADNALMMIHDPAMSVRGGSADMRQAAELLDNVKEMMVRSYARTKKGNVELSKMMADTTWMTAKEAKDHGFVDNITGELKAAAFAAPENLHVPERYQALFNQITKPQPKPEEKPNMADTTKNEPVAADYAALKAGCVGADAAFLCSQLEAKATLADAQAAWMKEQNTRLLAAQKEATDAKAAIPKPGVRPVNTGPNAKEDGAGEGGDPVAAWNDKLQANKKKFPNDPQKAVRMTARENPDLHAEYVAAANNR